MRHLIEALPSRRMLTVYLPDPTFAQQSFTLYDTPEDLAFRSHAWTVGAGGELLVAGYLTDADGRIDLAVQRFTPAGTLDTTFSGDGFYTRSGSGATPLNRATAILEASDGNLVVAGVDDDQAQFAFIRLQPDGSVDTSFGTGGLTQLDVRGTIDFGRVASMQNIAGGKILVAGTASVSGGSPVIVLLQLNADGSVDSSFGTSGVVVTDFAGPEAADLSKIFSVQGDGKIVVAGGTTASNARSGLRRYNADGTADSGFGTAGLASVDLEPTQAEAFGAVKALSDGKYLAAGTADAGASVSIARFTSAGALDVTFNGDGTSIIALEPLFAGGQEYSVRDVLVRPDNSLLVSVSEYVNPLLRDRKTLVVTADGELDDSILLNGALPNGDVIESGSKLLFRESSAIQRYGNDKITISGGTFSYAGTGGADSLSLNGEGDEIVVNDASAQGRLKASAINQISIDGGAGSDTLFVTHLAKPTTVLGGVGYDQISIYGNGVDITHVGMLIDGGAGADYLTTLSTGNAPGSNEPGSLITVVGGTGNDRIISAAARIYGNGGKDNIYGGEGRQYINGGAGNDAINGGGQNDIIHGAGGEDTLNGDNGRDRLLGEIGDDLLIGGSGDDTLDGGAGSDNLTGRTGNDILIAADGAADTLKGGEDDDTLASVDELLDTLYDTYP